MSDQPIKYRLLKDQESNFRHLTKQIVYAREHDLVTEISDRGDVCICQTAKGTLFAVRKAHLKKVEQ